MINGFCKPLIDVKNTSSAGGFTVRSTATSSWIPEHSFHHRSASIEICRCAARDPAGGSSLSGTRVGIKSAPASDAITSCRIESFWQIFYRYDASERAWPSVRIRRLLHCLLPRPGLRERLCEARLRDLGIVVGLQAQPPAIGKPEEAAQPQVGVGGDGALAGDDPANALLGHTDLLRQPVVAHSQGLEELLDENFAGGHRLEFPAHVVLPQ